MSDRPKLTIYCKLEQADLNGFGKLSLVISKEDTQLLASICKLLRELFLEKDIYLYITLLGEQ
jgi:hypothetical protein